MATVLQAKLPVSGVMSLNSAAAAVPPRIATYEQVSIPHPSAESRSAAARHAMQRKARVIRPPWVRSQASLGTTIPEGMWTSP